MDESNKCLKIKDKFCYICGVFVTKNQKRPLSESVKRLYEEKFGWKVIVGANFVPSFCCRTCERMLYHWKKGSRNVRMISPMCWRKPFDHTQDCYFCASDLKGFSTKSKNLIRYPEFGSALPPLKRAKLGPGKNKEVIAMDSSDSSEEYMPEDSKIKPLKQSEVNQLVKKLYLPKDKSEFLCSRLKENGLVDKNVKTTTFRSRNNELKGLFLTENTLTYCPNISSLLLKVGYPAEPEKYRLFIDSSRSSLKVALLHNGNQLETLPVAYSTTMKETRQNFETILQKLNYQV